ncbi:MAG: DNA repair protein RadA [Bacteroidales bacterium]|jgi:DNA repair protein RadA/Sms|nr:DNA repair protein RadA [Bacteroidales bacterium]
MAKKKTVWYCTECGYESPKWMGQCPSCGAWNTMQEETVVKETGASATSRNRSLFNPENTRPVPLSEISTDIENRTSLGGKELDRVLGGGMVSGSIVLLGGEPGIGKSTLSLQIPLKCNKLTTLYVSGEESAKQIKLRGERLGGEQKNCMVLAETLLENIIDQARNIKPDLLIIDSIQTIYSQNIDSSAGSVSQVKECAATLLRYAKETGTPVIIIGHITKDGSIAGPKILEHIVDVVLQFEGDTRQSFRILRSIKNRFGSTDELAVYQMTGTGLEEIVNPSELFMPMHGTDLSGIAIAAMIDGSRPFLIEVQALVSTAAYGTPQRSATGFDVRRMNMLLAVLEKRVGFKLSQKDVFLNISGGIKIDDPACDLAIIAAILSSNFDIPLSQRTAFIGEAGLSGEIRPASQTEKRIAEAAKLGFEKVFISKYEKIPGLTAGQPHPEIIRISTIADLVKATFR